MIKICISVLCLLLLIVPYSSVYVADDSTSEGTWAAVYVLDDLLLNIICLPFVLLWFIYLLLRNSIAKKIINVALLAAATFYCLTVLASGGGQDWEPHVGAYLSLLLFPFLLGLSYIEFRRPMPQH